MKIIDDSYSLDFIEDENKIIIKGALRLQTVEKYEEIMNFILKNAYISSEILTIDLTQLSYINSAGIASLGLFFIKLREQDKKIRLLASRHVSWHETSLKDFQIINDNIELEYVVLH